MPDKFQQILAEAHAAFYVWGDSTTGEFLLLHFPPHIEEMAARGFQFLGIIGLVDGAAKSALAVPLDEAFTESIAAALAARFAPQLLKAWEREVDWMKFAQSLVAHSA